MKSKAAIQGHPLHPALVPVPIGAWALVLVGDLVYANTMNGFWYQFSYYAMLIGLVGALSAAVLGFIDYFGVKMSEAGHRSAKLHMTMNLIISALYAVNLWLRADFKAISGNAWTLVFALEVVCFLALGVSGWIGGELTFKHKVGVQEQSDAEATEIGMAEPATPERMPTRTRGLQG